jgi:hypothetical protein
MGKHLLRSISFQPLLKSEECLRWDKVDWQSGEYDVVLQSRNHNTIVRYAARFILSVNPEANYRWLEK